MTKLGHIIKIKVIVGTIRISEVGKALQMIGMKANIIEVIKEMLRIEKGHMTEVDIGIEIIEEDLVEKEEIVNLEIEVDPLLGGK